MPLGGSRHYVVSEWELIRPLVTVAGAAVLSTAEPVAVELVVTVVVVLL